MSSSKTLVDAQPKKSGSYLMTALGFTFIFLIMLLILATCTETGRKYADNFKDKVFTNKQKLRDLDVLMFMSPTCPHCVKTIDILRKEGEINNLTIIDVNQDEGRKIAEQYGADKRPVPSFVSRKTHRSAIGSIENVLQLVKALYPSKNLLKSSEESSEESSNEENSTLDTDLIQKLEIVLFASDNCGYCVKTKEECNKAGIIKHIKIVDVSTPEGQQVVSELLPPGTTGVPVWLSMASKKHVIGYRPIPTLLKELQ